MEKTIASGAEARIVKINKTTLKKIRDRKTYRIKEIDNKLRKSRCKKEFKILSKLYENGINVPKPYEITINNEEIYFTFEFINGESLKNKLNKELLFKAFEQIIKLHNLDVVHSDLTTLNMLVKENEIYIIDFGLGKITNKIEEKATDLNLFFNCIKNEHPDFYRYKKELIEKYLNEKDGEKIIKRLENIEKRGRNKK